jgi:single-strand DNA-binding protein
MSGSMADMTTLTGVVATIPNHRITAGGLAITSFRLASSHRRFDKEKNGWVDGETNWYTVSAFRHLAFNTAHSLRKGERIVVTGRLHVRNWAKDDRRGTNIEVEADAIGHDLFWCTTSFVRSAPQPAQRPFSERYPAEPSGGDFAASDPNALGAPAASADWMANPVHGSVGWADTGTGEADGSGDLIDPDPDDPYETSEDGFLPASEPGMATVDS